MKYLIVAVLFVFSGLAMAKGNSDVYECSDHAKGHNKDCQEVKGATPVAKKSEPAVKKKAPVKINLVLETQKQLNRLGYNTGPVDGIMGKKTRSAIMRFQRDHRDPVTGKTSAQLLAKLKKTVRK